MVKNKLHKPRFDPIDREIIRSMKDLKLRVTPSKIANTINVHPSTVKNRLKALDKARITDSIKRGNRTLTKLRRPIKKKESF